MEHHGFNWISLIPGVGRESLNTLVTSLLVLALIYWVGRRARVSLERDPGVPADRFGPQALFELIVEFLTNTVRSIIPHHPERYFWLLGSVFVFVLFNNLIGLVPGFSPPTGDPHTNAAIAIVVFVAYHYYGIKENGAAYVRQFTGPFTGVMLIFSVLMVPIELIGHVFRPVTLTVRLYANMLADHTTVANFTNLTYFAVPAIFLALGLLVCVIQAFVFFILSTVYIGLAVSHDH
jgi:F-type H+-transporting ATPase subunit a